MKDTGTHTEADAAAFEQHYADDLGESTDSDYEPDRDDEGPRDPCCGKCVSGIDPYHRH